MSADQIDFVVTWVDGNDPVWQEAKSHYAPADADIRAARYRDWEQLKYWFRAVEKYAPWVNKIHFVTFGHLPKWLNIDNPKLHIVKHEDFIPKEYLPVFNSTAIEIYLHCIPGLSENFVYFNDDFYLMKPSQPEDFLLSFIQRLFDLCPVLCKKEVSKAPFYVCEFQIWESRAYQFIEYSV